MTVSISDMIHESLQAPVYMASFYGAHSRDLKNVRESHELGVPHGSFSPLAIVITASCRLRANFIRVAGC